MYALNILLAAQSLETNPEPGGRHEWVLLW